MSFFEALRLALHTIWLQKLKSFFSLLGVFIGVTFLIAVVTVVEGMNRYMTDRFATALLGVNTFQLRRYPDFQVGEITPETWRQWRRRPSIEQSDAHALARALTVRALVAWESDQDADVEYQGRIAADIRIIGAPESYFEVKAWRIGAGRAFSAHEAQAGRPVVVIGEELANRLFDERDPLGREVRIRGIPYRVVGVVESQGNILGLSLDKFAVAPARSPVRRFVNPGDVVDAVLVKTHSVSDMREAMVQTEAVMRSRRGLRPTVDNDFAVETADAVLEFWGKINRILLMALPGLVTIALVVAGIVIMNIMLVSVAERTREIGIRKAVGATRRDILSQFLIESATLALLGAGLGILTGIALADLVQQLSPLPASVAPWSIGVAVLLGGGVGIAAGVYPARRAARLDPVHAMREE